jgi:hypothetical protein
MRGRRKTQDFAAPMLQVVGTRNSPGFYLVASDSYDGGSIRLAPTREIPIYSAAAFHQPNQDVGVNVARFLSVEIAEASSS